MYYNTHAITFKNFHEINYLVTSLVKTAIWREKNVFFRKNKSCVLHIVHSVEILEILEILSHAFFAKISWK